MARSSTKSLCSRKVSINEKEQSPRLLCLNKCIKKTRYLNTLLLSVSIAISLCILLAKAVKNHKQDHQYTLINQKSQLPSYGAVDITSDSSSSDTAVTPSIEFEKRYQPWSVYNFARLILSVFQLALIVYGTWSLIHDGSQEIDREVEGTYNNLLLMYYARIGFWVILLYFIHLYLIS